MQITIQVKLLSTKEQLQLIKETLDKYILTTNETELLIDIKDINIIGKTSEIIETVKVEKSRNAICIAKDFFDLFPAEGEWLTAREITDCINNKVGYNEQIKTRVLAYQLIELGVANKKGHSNKTLYRVEKI